MLNIENFETKFKNIVKSEEWKKVESIFRKSRYYFTQSKINYGIYDYG